jgi:hypothetical protein
LNIKRFILATIAAFVFIFIFEWLWHGMLMKGMYEATKDVWRPEDASLMIYVFASLFLFAAVLTYIYTVVGKHLPCKRGIAFGFFAGLLLAMPNLGAYAHMPIPLTIPLMWMLSMVIECLGAGMVIAAIYKEPTAA